MSDDPFDYNIGKDIMREQREEWHDHHYGRDLRFLPGWWIIPMIIAGAACWGIGFAVAWYIL